MLDAPARVVDEDIEAAKFSADIFCQRIHARAIRDIGRHGQDAATESANICGDRIELFGRSRREHEVRAFSGKGEGDGATNAASTARHQGDFFSEF